MSEWWTRMDDALKAHNPSTKDSPPPKRSSVAAIIDLRPEPHVLLMRRVEYERDPWSGHISLPGGRSSPEDNDLLDTAIRETREEVDIDLRTSARLLGRLAPRQAISRGKKHGMDVTPFIFRLEQEVEPAPLEEAEELFWLPLDQAAQGAFDGEHLFSRSDLVHNMPCWNFESFVVWGMTYRILTNLMTICGAK